MAIHELRPRSIGELFDGAFGIYRATFVVVVSIVIVCQGLPTVLNAYVLLGGGPFVQFEVFLVALFFSGLGATVSGAAIVVVVSDAMLDNAPVMARSLRAAVDAFISLFIAGLARLLLVLLASLLFLIPGVIVACGYIVIEQIIMLEKPDSAVSSLPRSWKLTRGYKGKVFGLAALLLLFLQVLPTVIAGALAAALPVFDASVQIGSTLLQLVLFPLLPITFTLLYYDLRVRQEAFDLELLSARLGMSESALMA